MNMLHKLKNIVIALTIITVMILPSFSNVVVANENSPRRTIYERLNALDPGLDRDKRAVIERLYNTHDNIGNFERMWRMYAPDENMYMLGDSVRIRDRNGAYTIQPFSLNPTTPPAQITIIGPQLPPQEIPLTQAQREQVQRDREVFGGMETPPPSSGGGNEEFLAVATRLWINVRVSGRFSRYTLNGISVPPPGPFMDCSTFVSWALYVYGYRSFRGFQHNTAQFMAINWNARYGWERIRVAPGQNVTNILQPGDILVRRAPVARTGHINIIHSVVDGRVYGYGVGNARVMQDRRPAPLNYTWFAARDSRPGWIIRVGSPPNRR